MKKIKVSEATGPALDWLVAKCEGLPTCDSGEVWITDPSQPHFSMLFKPSTYWSQGGPIIEREYISVSVGDFDIDDTPIVSSWAARSLKEEMKNGIWVHGPTPLIAAMRCYCYSKLGKEVEVPEGLL